MVIQIQTKGNRNDKVIRAWNWPLRFLQCQGVIMTQWNLRKLLDSWGYYLAGVVDVTTICQMEWRLELQQQTNTKVSSRSNSEKLPAPADVSRELGFKKWATKTKRYFTKVLLNFPLPFNFSSLSNMIPIWNWNFKLYLAHQKSMTYKKECWNWRGWWGFSFWQWRGLFGWLLLLLWRRIL